MESRTSLTLSLTQIYIVLNTYLTLRMRELIRNEMMCICDQENLNLAKKSLQDSTQLNYVVKKCKKIVYILYIFNVMNTYILKLILSYLFIYYNLLFIYHICKIIANFYIN